jgi:hypothetical protein
LHDVGPFFMPQGRRGSFMLEELLQQHAGTAGTLLVCVAAGWRFAHSALGAYTDRTTAIREAVLAAEGIAKSLRGVRLSAGGNADPRPPL